MQSEPHWSACGGASIALASSLRSDPVGHPQAADAEQASRRPASRLPGRRFRCHCSALAVVLVLLRLMQEASCPAQALVGRSFGPTAQNLLGGARCCQGSKRFCRRRSLATRLAADPARVVFLGSPDCVCTVLQQLVDGATASSDEPVPYEVAAVVSQPPRKQKVKKKLVPVKTPIHQLAEELGIEPILIPESARDADFLEALEAVKPDLCITAAYGQYLPKRFLRAPRLGTLNLHPSLLPRWRGASPVQRSLVAGDEITGISVLYTVTKMDAGPIVLQRERKLLGNETSRELLDELFALGGKLLVEEVLEDVLSGKVTQDTASQQDEDEVTLAPLIRKDEGMLWPHNETAVEMLNKVRGFYGWPGTTFPVGCSTPFAGWYGYRFKVADAAIMPASALRAEDLERPVEELIYVQKPDVVDGPKTPAIAVRPATDKENVLLLRSWLLPGIPVQNAKQFRKNHMPRDDPARWMGPEEETEMEMRLRPPPGHRRSDG